MTSILRISGLCARLAASCLLRGFACVLALAVALACSTAAASAVPACAPPSEAADLSREGATALPPRLVVGVVAGGWAPLEIVDGATLTGFSADYLHLIAGAGVRLEPRVFQDLPALLAAACAGEIDIVMSLARTP